MRFVVAGGGVGGLAAALAVARAGHEAIVLERDVVANHCDPLDAVRAPRAGIPHFLQPHAFLPRGLRELSALAPVAVAALYDAGAHEQDLSRRLATPVEPGDDELVYLWVRRPIIELAIRRAAIEEPGVALRAGVTVAGLVRSDDGTRALGVALAGGEVVTGDVVVDALGRYRPPPGWHRPPGESHEAGVLYYTRYFELAPGVEHLDGTLLSPRGDLGYMGFNTFRGDNRTFSVIVQTPVTDRELRVLKRESAWMRACSLMQPLDVMTSPDYARPITPVMPMGGLQNTDRTGDPGVGGLVALGDSICHTDPAFSYGLGFALAQARALAVAAASGLDGVEKRYRDAVGDEARERFELACAIDAARTARWAGEPLDIGRRDGCYPLFAFAAAYAAAPYDDHVLRRAIRRIGMLDRTAVFDRDTDVHARIEAIFARLMQDPAPPQDRPARSSSRSSAWPTWRRSQVALDSGWREEQTRTRGKRKHPQAKGLVMSVRSLALAALASSVLVIAPAALADPNPDNNKNAVERVLTCTNGETLTTTFAGLEGSDFNIASDQRVFLYKWIHIDEIPIGVDSSGDVTTNRGLQGISPERLVTCNYTTGTGAYVTAIGFFTGPGG